MAYEEDYYQQKLYRGCGLERVKVKEGVTDEWEGWALGNYHGDEVSQ